MNEDFTEEEEFDELPEGVEMAEPPTTPAPTAHVVAPAPAAQAAPALRGRRTEDAQAKFEPYIMPKRVGVMDTETNQPLMEDENIDNLLLGLMTKLLNDIEDIKNNL